MKKLLLSGVAVVGAVLAPVMLAAPASAAPAPQAAIQTTSDSTVGVLGFWADVAYFATMQDCVGAGEYGRHRGTWSAFECSWVPRKGALLRAFYN
ncbi:hypothetical protein [Kribbella catacumbae]|uniref:hypothetical protein n=1 Tax=Kribbella catacumbae TaxID=460086 RepID=UPI00036DEC38|nr:hypothetical protein [Kribbella catacumbae]